MKHIITIFFIAYSLSGWTQSINDFTLEDVGTNESFNLQANSNKDLVVIIFFSNECAFTKYYVNRINDLNTFLKSNNSTLVLINSNSDRFSPEESNPRMQAFLKNNGLKTPYLSDKDKVVAKSLGARRTPEAFVLAFEGNQAVLKYKGAIDDNAQSPGDVNHSFLNDAVRNLLENKEISKTSTRANGCLIK